MHFHFVPPDYKNILNRYKTPPTQNAISAELQRQPQPPKPPPAPHPPSRNIKTAPPSPRHSKLRLNGPPPSRLDTDITQHESQ